MVEVGDYGVVRVIAGRHKGKVGYYDDDYMQIREGESKTAIVYFARILEGPYELIPRRYLEPTEEPFVPLEQFLRDRPLAHQQGVHRREP